MLERELGPRRQQDGDAQSVERHLGVEEIRGIQQVAVPGGSQRKGRRPPGQAIAIAEFTRDDEGLHLPGERHEQRRRQGHADQSWLGNTTHTEARTTHAL